MTLCKTRQRQYFCTTATAWQTAKLFIRWLTASEYSQRSFLCLGGYAKGLEATAWEKLAATDIRLVRADVNCQFIRKKEYAHRGLYVCTVYFKRKLEDH